MDEKIFKGDAKQIVDTAFDKKLFKDEITRDHMQEFEDLISYLLQSRYDGYIKMTKLLEKIENKSK
jgi:hypothetical protein